MTAGASAGRRSTQLSHDADALFELARLKRREARNYAIACSSEQGLAGILRPLSELGWTVLEDRRWPGSKRANIDFLLVGPAGIVIVDAKHWDEPAIRDGSIYRGDSREDDEIAKLNTLAERIAEAVDHTGLTLAAITTVMVFTSRQLHPVTLNGVTIVGDEHFAKWLASLRPRLEPQQVTIMAAEVEIACPEMPSKAEPTMLKVKTLRQPAAQDAGQDALIDVEALAEELMDAAMKQPIEGWMTFLHPDQNKLVRSQWSGPARVRGPAGTGKTVVGLHRAVHIAERSSNPVLFVSYVRTLPIVLSGLARRMSDRAADNIEFTGIHQLALRVLDAAGRKLRIDAKGADAAFRDAWRLVNAAQALGRIDERPAYWREEIDHVIKGRGLTSFDDYKNLQRVGRKTRLATNDREVVWDLYARYQANLKECGIHDFNDLLIQAHDVVNEFPDLFRYSAVIVDEVQDLNLVGLKFLATLADGVPHSLLLVGDGQQSVYPGGFNLSEAGISVAGRASVLRVNYRNTHEIVQAATRHVAGAPFDDLDGELVPGARDAEVARRGNRPIVIDARHRAELDTALVWQLRQTIASGASHWGDLAVLLLHRRDVDRYRAVLTRAGIPHVELTEYDGVTTDRVKIGTIKRSKGLEFKYVLMPNLRRADPPAWAGETADSYAERCERIRRELYVGMTRARDGLWLGYLD